MYDDAQWFDGLGTCRCGKPATGVLRGTRNQSFGPYCRRCAEARIKKAEKERERAPPHPAAVALSGKKLLAAARQAVEAARCDHELEPSDHYTVSEKASIRVCRKCGTRFTSYREA